MTQASGRHETQADRLDRNWSDLLQELRVAETGVQLLTGLLLTVPFQARFPELQPHQVIVYLATVSLSLLATGLLISPVVLHRVLFRQHARGTLVAAAQRLALAGFAVLGLAVVGVCLLIFDVVLGLFAGIVAGATALLVVVLLWGVGPLVMRDRHEHEHEDGDGDGDGGRESNPPDRDARSHRC